MLNAMKHPTKSLRGALATWQSIFSCHSRNCVEFLLWSWNDHHCSPSASDTMASN